MSNTGRSKILGIIQARMDSTRFPGKMTGELCGQSLLELVISRAKLIADVDKIIVATTSNRSDDIIEQLAEKREVNVYRGSVDDVASRFLACIQQYGGDYFIRLNGDSPCIDHDLIEEGIGHCSKGYDIITNIPSRTFPYGISLELVRTGAFTNSYAMMDNHEKEHVTSYFYKNLDKYSYKEITNRNPKHITFRFTIDVPEDLERLRVFLGTNPYRSWKEAQ